MLPQNGPKSTENASFPVYDSAVAIEGYELEARDVEHKRPSPHSSVADGRNCCSRGSLIVSPCDTGDHSYRRIFSGALSKIGTAYSAGSSASLFPVTAVPAVLAPPPAAAPSAAPLPPPASPPVGAPGPARPPAITAVRLPLPLRV